MDEQEHPRKRLGLPARRALGALIGAAVAMLGWFVTERARQAGGLKLAENAPDLAFQLALIGLPVIAAWALGLLLAAKRPATRSGVYATAVTLAAMVTGSLIYAVVGAAQSPGANPLEFVLVFLFVLFFSFVRVGFIPLLVGWLVVWLWDRRLVERAH